MAQTPKQPVVQKPAPHKTGARKKRTSLEFCEPRAIMSVVRSRSMGKFSLEDMVAAVEDHVRATAPELLDDDMVALTSCSARELPEVIEICLTDMVADQVLSFDATAHEYLNLLLLRNLLAVPEKVS